LKASFVSVVVCLVAVAFTGVAFAGPTSPLYLTYYQYGQTIAVVQGNTITTFPEAYGNASYEVPIAVYGDVRTTGSFPASPRGGQYSLAGVPSGTSYVLPSVIQRSDDSTSDGSHNYLLDEMTSTVYQTARDFTNPVALFNVPLYQVGITYDRANNSLWISGYDTFVIDYSLSGGYITSFSTGLVYGGALALDPATHTLWLVDNKTGYLYQYSTAGVLLSTGPYVGFALGGEFNLAPTPTPEPGTLVMFGSGALGLAGLLRRKINL